MSTSNNPYNDNFVSGGYFYNSFRRDLTLVKGDTLAFAFEIKGLKGQIPSSIVFTCKESIDTTNILFEITNNDTIKFKTYDEENDVLTYTLRIPPYISAELDLGRFYYDLELQANNDVFTLMKGRLIVDYEVTGDNTPEPPEYEDGDPIRYPIITQEGVVKRYTEEYISDIAQGIQDINGLTLKYNTQEMSAALADIKDDIDALRAALNSSIGTPLNIPLEDIPSAVSSDKIISKWELCKKWFERYNESRNNLAAGIAYFLDNETYGLIPANDYIKLGVKMSLDQTNGLKVSALSINNNWSGNEGIVGNLSDYESDVRANYSPYWITDFSYGAFAGYSENFEDLPFLNAGYLQISELSEANTLPALRSLVSNERACQASELKSLLEALSWKHIISSSSYVNLPFPISSIYGFIYYSSGDLQILSNDTPNSGVGTFDTDTGTYTGGTGLYNIINNIIGVPIHEPRQYLDTTWANWGIISGFHGRNNTTIQDVSDDVILHTEPIKDQNGNILIPANCSISDFFDL